MAPNKPTAGPAPLQTARYEGRRELQLRYVEAIARGAPPEKVQAIIERAVDLALGQGPDARHWAKLVLDKALPDPQVVALLGVGMGGGAAVDWTRLPPERLAVLRSLVEEARGAGGGSAGRGGVPAPSGEVVDVVAEDSEVGP